MDTTTILSSGAEINQSIASKARRLVSAWLLAEVVLLGAVFKFMERLNEKGILGLGEGFSSNQFFWGEGLGLNIFRLLIVFIFAGLFGVTYGYLSRGVSTSERIIVNTINSFLTVFGSFLLILIALAIFTPDGVQEVNSSIGIVLNVIVSSPFYFTLLIFNVIGVFAFGFLCVNLGSKIIENPYHSLDKEKAGTLLGIKWYHYLWLWIPIGFYAQVALNLLYATGHAIITFVRNVSWFEFLGVSTSSGNDSAQNNVEVVWSKLFGIWIAGVIMYFMLDYLRRILAGEKQMHWAIKILISFCIGIVVPFLLIWFTVLGG